MEERWQYVQTKGGVACQLGTPLEPGEPAWTDGIKTCHGARQALVTPSFHQYGWLTGSQTSQRGELMGYCRAGDMLQNAKVVLDTVKKVAHQAPHREASDMVLRIEAA